MNLNWTVVCFAGIDYRSHHQRPQAIARDLARRGALVVYVDNLGLRLPGIGDAHRVTGRVADRGREAIRGSRPDPFGVTVYSPLVPPLQQLRPVGALARRALLARLRGSIPPGRPLIVWTYLPHPVIRDVAGDLGADLLVYDWADDASEHLQTRSDRHRARVRGWEDDMAARADVLFAASEELLDRRRPANRNVHLIAHGAASTGAGDPAPSEVTRMAHPRVVLVGSLSRWIDVDLLAGLAEARPDWSFVLVGPRRARLARLARRDNVLLTGERPYSEIPSILRACDVALIPYRRAPATLAASPVKLWDYLAEGLPVVSVDVPAVRRHEGPTVQIAEGVGGFAAAVERALAHGRSASPERRTWSDAVDEMVEHISAAFDGRPAAAPARGRAVAPRERAGGRRRAAVSLGRTVVKTVSAAADAARRHHAGVVVLLYHRIGLGTGSEVDLPTPLFAQHMEMLAASGRAATLDGALGVLDEGPPEGPDPVVVTFDDGTADFVDNALPVLERWRVPATLYVATHFVDEGVSFPRDGTPLSWSGLREVAASGLVTVGSHTHSHRLLDRTPDAEVDEELERSVELIGEHVGVEAAHFAYPKAVPPSPYAEAAVRSRFESAALAGAGANRYGATDRYRLSRAPVQVSDGIRWFRRKLDGGMLLEGALRARLDRVRYRHAVR